MFDFMGIKLMEYTRKANNTDIAIVVSGGAFFITMLAAWLTHIIHCLAAAKYLLLIAGGFIFPVGIIHGISVWLGAGW